jgi:hypothetical protein
VIITAEEFQRRFAVAPQRDDLERLACETTGILHAQCGLCTMHKTPRTLCGCTTVATIPRIGDWTYPAAWTCPTHGDHKASCCDDAVVVLQEVLQGHGYVATVKPDGVRTFSVRLQPPRNLPAHTWSRCSAVDVEAIVGFLR